MQAPGSRSSTVRQLLSPRDGSRDGEASRVLQRLEQPPIDDLAQRRQTARLGSAVDLDTVINNAGIGQLRGSTEYMNALADEHKVEVGQQQWTAFPMVMTRQLVCILPAMVEAGLVPLLGHLQPSNFLWSCDGCLHVRQCLEDERLALDRSAEPWRVELPVEELHNLYDNLAPVRDLDIPAVVQYVEQREGAATAAPAAAAGGAATLVLVPLPDYMTLCWRVLTFQCILPLATGFRIEQPNATPTRATWLDHEQGQPPSREELAQAERREPSGGWGPRIKAGLRTMRKAVILPAQPAGFSLWRAPPKDCFVAGSKRANDKAARNMHGRVLYQRFIVEMMAAGPLAIDAIPAAAASGKWEHHKCAPFTTARLLESHGHVMHRSFFHLPTPSGETELAANAREMAGPCAAVAGAYVRSLPGEPCGPLLLLDGKRGQWNESRLLARPGPCAPPIGAVPVDSGEPRLEGAQLPNLEEPSWMGPGLPTETETDQIDSHQDSNQEEAGVSVQMSPVEGSMGADPDEEEPPFHPDMDAPVRQAGRRRDRSSFESWPLNDLRYPPADGPADAPLSLPDYDELVAGPRAGPASPISDGAPDDLFAVELE